MKSIINALAYKQNSSGIGVLIRDLFGPYSHIAQNRCRIIMPQDGPDFPAGPGTEVIRIACDHGNGLKRMVFQTFRMGRDYCRDGVLLTTDSKTPFFLPGSCALVPLITDLAVYRMPQAYQISRVLWWRLQHIYVRRRARCFLAISEFTKKELEEIWHIPSEKIHVVPCACSDAYRPVTDMKVLQGVCEKYGLPEKFVLFVGNSNPRKNLERMIRAFDQAKEEGDLPHQLIIAGGQGWKFDQAKALEGIRHWADVRFIGFVPDEDMPALYSAASLFVFPTLYEGFGIPILEAQACGTPVLTSNCSSLPEVGGQGAWYVDPYDCGDISKGIRKILGDAELSARLIQEGFENKARFSWQDSARKLNEIVETEVAK